MTIHIQQFSSNGTLYWSVIDVIVDSFGRYFVPVTAKNWHKGSDCKNHAHIQEVA